MLNNRILNLYFFLFQYNLQNVIRDFKTIFEIFIFPEIPSC